MKTLSALAARSRNLRSADRSRRSDHSNSLQLNSEQLEPRMMLSAVEIIAAGVTNQENIELQIDGQSVETFTTVGGDAYGGQFVSLTHNTVADVTADQIRIALTNDLYDAANGIDRNVRIDAIVIDGTRYETEASDVYSTGTWLSEDGIQPGFRTSEYLHTDGYFQYASGTTGDGSLLQIRAAGSEGNEQFDLQIDGTTVRSFSVTDTQSDYLWQANDVVTADQVRIVFTNDQYDPDNGIDANLNVDFIRIDGTTFQTEAPDVYSTGTWLAADGIQPGFRQSQTLHTNGYFQFAAGPTSQPGQLSLSLDTLTINEDAGELTFVVFRSGGSDGAVSVDFTKELARATPTFTRRPWMTNGLTLRMLPTVLTGWKSKPTLKTTFRNLMRPTTPLAFR